MANTNSSKGNPASKRMSNVKLKAKRERSWAAGRQRKEARQAKQDLAHRQNLERISRGIRTPWQIAKDRARQRKLDVS